MLFHLAPGRLLQAPPPGRRTPGTRCCRRTRRRRPRRRARRTLRRAGMSAVSSSACVSSERGRPWMRSSRHSASASAMAVRCSSGNGWPSASGTPMLSAAVCAASSMRVTVPSSSVATSLPPTLTAAVCWMRPAWTSANFVVPPPMSTFSTVCRGGARELHCSGAISREHGLQVVPSRSADELARLVREDVCYRVGVTALDRLTREDDCPAVDVLRLEARLCVRLGDEPLELLRVDEVVVRVRREQDGRLVERLPVHDDVPAGVHLLHALERDAGEHEVRRGRADVDADRRELDDLVVVVVVVGVVQFDGEFGEGALRRGRGCAPRARRA